MNWPVDISEEQLRLDAALEKTRIQTLFLEKRVAETLSDADAAIFHTHLMILEDRSFLDKSTREIGLGHSAPYALKKVTNDYIEAFDRMEDPYLRERAADMEDIGRRLIANLVGARRRFSAANEIPGHPGSARRLLPSDMAALDHEQILGIVTEAGRGTPTR